MKDSFLGLPCHRSFQAVQGPVTRLGPLVPQKKPTAVLWGPLPSTGSVSWKERQGLRRGRSCCLR